MNSSRFLRRKSKHLLSESNSTMAKDDMTAVVTPTKNGAVDMTDESQKCNEYRRAGVNQTNKNNLIMSVETGK